MTAFGGSPICQFLRSKVQRKSFYTAKTSFMKKCYVNAYKRLAYDGLLANDIIGMNYQTLGKGEKCYYDGI